MSLLLTVLTSVVTTIVVLAIAGVGLWCLILWATDAEFDREDIG